GRFLVGDSAARAKLDGQNTESIRLPSCDRDRADALASVGGLAVWPRPGATTAPGDHSFLAARLGSTHLAVDLHRRGFVLSLAVDAAFGAGQGAKSSASRARAHRPRHSR